MVEHFYIEPEVAGGLGDRTTIDRGVHPPILKRLHYKLDGWMGDALLESFPTFIVTKEAKETLLAIDATGASFDVLELTVTDQFKELYPNRRLPEFAWLKVDGEAGLDDFGTAADGRLVVSRRALDSLRALGISHALVEPFEGRQTLARANT